MLWMMIWTPNKEFFKEKPELKQQKDQSLRLHLHIAPTLKISLNRLFKVRNRLNYLRKLLLSVSYKYYFS